MPYSYPYPRPSVTCDVVAFTMRDDGLAVLLIRRKDEPFKGAWALPGGFVDENERLERAALRELSEETGLTGVKLVQLGAFGDPGRDPRGHTITIAYVSFLMTAGKLSAGDDATVAEWVPFHSLSLDEGGLRAAALPAPKRARASRKRRNVDPNRLAFDHARIIGQAYRRVLRHIDDPIRDTAFDIVPTRFTLAELQRIYEIILGRPLSARVFRKNATERGLVVPASTKPAPKRAGQLYRWNR